MFGIPVWKKDYSDKKRVKEATKRISQVIRPGDVVNCDACLDSWWNFQYSFAWRLIWFDQKLVFGGNARYKDEHTMIFLDEKNTFSMQPPAAIYKPLEKYCLDPIAVYRYTPKAITAPDVKIMREQCDQLIGVKYDIPQLINMLFNTILGFPDADKIKLFKEGYVCSVAARTVYEKWRKKWNEAHPKEKLERLFNHLNPYLDPPGALVQRFHKGAVKEGVEIEMTSPAHFANSPFYTHEFQLVGMFNNGENVM